MAASLILVTGPARSGKSEWAETLAAHSGKSVTYVATAQTNDTDLEWQARIERHRQRRPSNWQTEHVPVNLGNLLLSTPDSTCLLVDSLGTWLANVLDQDDATWTMTQNTFISAIQQTSSMVILVAEETGWGVVPAYPIGRTFRDRLGTLTRHIGSIADQTYLVTAGHILNLTQLGTPLPPQTE